MTNKLQFGKWLATLGICALLTAPSFAQRGRANWQQNRPPKQQPAAKPQQQAQRQQEKQQRQQQKQAQREAQRNTSRPPQPNAEPRTNNPNRPNGSNGEARANNPNRPPNAYTPPPPRKFDSLNSQEKQRAIENNKRFQNLTPAQKQQAREATANWNRLTPEQKIHLKNDVMPRWQQLPPQRQKAIQQRLGVLKNMPESARNQHLNDPNFTRGMNEEDKATLRDLSHLHVGGAPEPPPNE
jgi:hypothetical protein